MLRTIISQATKPVMAGAVLGFAGAIALAAAMASSVTEVEARDPVSYMGVVLTVAIMTMLATYIPARRASMVDPTIALRAE
jgi:ABC-type lipoprotein release transport system permease subunit